MLNNDDNNINSNLLKMKKKHMSVTNDMNRKCHKQRGTVDRITSEWKTLARTENTTRHDAAVKVVY